jgi:AcrR family transcriptional regulator
MLARISSVARQVGIATPSIYAHFPDRDAILMAVVARIFDELTEAIEQGQKPTGQAPPAAWSRAARRTWPSGSPTPPATACCSPGSCRQRRTTARRSRSGPDGRPVLEFGADSFALLVQDIADCVTAGVSASTDVVSDATAVWVALHGTVSLRTVLPRFPWPDPATFVRQLVLPLARVTA